MASARRKLLILGVGLLGGAVAGLAGLAYLSLRHLRPPRFWPADAAPGDDFRPEDVSFPSADGVLLHGWFLPAAGAVDTLVLCHGYAMSRLETLALARALNDRAHHVLLFDFRAHGRSEGRFTSLGYREVHDLLGAVAFLQTRPEYTPGRLGVLGFSMGAVAAILAAARCPAIAAVVADSSYAALDHIVANGVRQMVRLPIATPARGIVRIGEWLVGLRAAAPPARPRRRGPPRAGRRGPGALRRGRRAARAMDRPRRRPRTGALRGARRVRGAGGRLLRAPSRLTCFLETAAGEDRELPARRAISLSRSLDVRHRGPIEVAGKGRR